MEPFGALVRQFRLATLDTTTRVYGGHLRTCSGPLSQNGLALRARIDPAYVHRIERGQKPAPTRRVVEALASGLELDAETTARLLVAAGYWPWTDADGDVAELIVAAGLAIVAGDWRRVPMPDGHQNGRR
jgi:hypothetical protein